MVGRAVRALAVLLLLVLVRVGAADGGFFGKLAGAELTIPDQRAIIVWHEGQQTLFVESNLRAAPGEYSWVIPLPAPPTEIGKARPSVMDLVFGELPPVVIQRVGVERHLAGMTLLVCLITALIVMRWRTRPRWERLAILFIVPPLAYVMYPVYAGGSASKSAAGSEMGAVEVLDRQTIGSYDVAVVKATDAVELEEWLARAGTPLPDKARPVIEDYVREDWCFMTARFRKDIVADAKPHPVRITFPTAQPVYPMRLTGVVSDSLDLDLMVIGPEVADVKPLRLLRSRRIVHAEPHPYPQMGVFSPSVPIGHADIAKDLVGTMIGTRMRGTVKKSQMQSDYSIAWAGTELHMPKFFSEDVARARGHAAGLWTMSGLVLLGAGLAIFRKPGSRETALWTILGMLLISTAAGGVVSAATPVLEIDEDAPRSRNFDPHIAVSCMRSAFKLAQKPTFEPFRARFQTALEGCAKRARISTHVKSWQKDDVGGYVLREVAPGEFELQIIDPVGQIEWLSSTEHRLTKYDRYVKLTFRLTPRPDGEIERARQAGILPDWPHLRVRLVRSDGRSFPAVSLGNGSYSADVVAGEFQVIATGPKLTETVKWEGKDRLKVPDQEYFTARGQFDVSRYFQVP